MRRTTWQERERKIREAKLADMREQVSSGALVIRQMTHAEQAASTKELAAFDARLTPTQRARRDAVLQERHRRAQHLVEPSVT